MHQNIAEQLWQLLDDIDSLSDSLKPASSPYTEAVAALVAKRHQLLKTDGHRLYWPPNGIPATIVGYEESRELADQRDEEGTLIGKVPVPGSERVSLHLSLSGRKFKARVDPKDFEEQVVPVFLANISPESTFFEEGFSLKNPSSFERLPIP